MRITLLTVGRIKERYLEEAIREYAKRLGRYCRLTIAEVPDREDTRRRRGGAGAPDQGEGGPKAAGKD